ncbi:ester cyclase [Aliiruegeria lutimaris]|uniref:Predicted ester cyclase n=1 Tax=Aliiruegeria lutimaris TaxID=571298 RepID=A0A1G8KWF8_9RHOB|nr:ester cyclase [Aliiruegeria lutimaris]SDI47716.1 Predicted ester cyclase [Aliiruegeria lutimaris]
MTSEEMKGAYRAYIACLNKQDWENLHRYVADQVEYNGKTTGLKGYRAMLVEDFLAIPDLCFTITHLASDPPIIASRLAFDCTPIGQLFGFPVNGKRVRFDENVFYEFRDGKIQSVWSVIDKAAIASQI